MRQRHILYIAGDLEPQRNCLSISFFQLVSQSDCSAAEQDYDVTFPRAVSNKHPAAPAYTHTTLSYHPSVTVISPLSPVRLFLSLNLIYASAPSLPIRVYCIVRFLFVCLADHLCVSHSCFLLLVCQEKLIGAYNENLEYIILTASFRTIIDWLT